MGRGTDRRLGIHANGLTRQEALRIFDLLYDRAWSGMGGRGVLGSTRPAVRMAYEGSLVGGFAPHFWLELPLIGPPHSDLHVSYDHGEMVADAHFDEGAGFGYEGLFGWFLRHGAQNTGIDFTFDLSESGIEAVGAYVSFRNAGQVDFEGFCAAIGHPDDAWRCCQAVSVFPEGWRVWYASPFPGREGNPVRAAALASDGLRQRFADDPSLVRRHLRHIGIASVPDELCERVSELARLPILLEWRIGVDAQGEVYDRCDVSFYLSNTYLSNDGVRRCFGADGVGTQALGLFEEWGAADCRWRDMVAGSYARKGPFRLDDGTRCELVGVCSPSCFMLPWDGGRQLPAKAYPKFEAFLVR